MADERIRVLVTGAAGLCGRQIAEHLHKCGMNVTGTYLNTPITDSFSGVRCDLAEPISALDGKCYDVIVHCAGALPYRNCDLQTYKKGNLDAMANLLRFAEKAKVKRMIYLSSTSVYGEFRDPMIDEDSPLINPDDYGITKYAAERLLSESGIVEGIALRMPGVAGTTHTHTHTARTGEWLKNTAEQFERNETVNIYSPDFITKNFVWTEDLARFVEKLIRMPEWKYHTLVLACSVGISIREAVELMRTELHSSSEIRVVPATRMPFCLNAERAFEMGYDPLLPAEIIRRYCASRMH